ncbi:MAG TPA: hypothetical protein VF173_00725 [Thermoanaerobaculia bacterium]|nr:hypothetical protein [Thermoanaerobaculia bacterium]
MAASGLWFVTPHAVRRYIKRFAPQATYEEALSTLIRASQEARRVKTLPTGLVLYRGPRPRRLRFFLQEDVEAPSLPILVTVLGRSEEAQEGQREPRAPTSSSGASRFL